MPAKIIRCCSMLVHHANHFPDRGGAISTSDDGRTRLLDHVLRFVGRYRPELVFSENVPGLRDDSCGREIFERLVATLQQMGYATTHNVIRSQEYGVPQHRARLVLLASVFGPVSFASRTHGADTPHTRLSTVGEWISALPAIAAGEAHPSVPNHRAAKLSSLNMQRIRSTPPGGGWQDLPSELMTEKPQIGIRRLYRRVWPPEMGRSGTGTHHKMHQLFEWAIRPSLPGSVHQRARSGLPSDFAPWIRPRRQSEFPGSPSWQRCAGTARRALRRVFREPSRGYRQ